MKTTYVSTQAISNATRRSIMEMQAELTLRQKEVTTGRVADVGLALGARSGQTVSLRQERAGLQTILDANAIAASRLEATQAALSALADNAQGLLGNLVDAKGNPAGALITEARAKERLAAFVGQLNATHNGEYLFAGINTDTKPIAGYLDNPSAAKQAVDDAFQARFGMAQTDPGVSAISAADMQDFLDAEFTALFDEPAWSATWSSASDQEMESRISSAETVATGSTANQPAVQKLAMAMTMMADLGGSNLSRAAYLALVDKASAVLGEAIRGISVAQAQLGSAQEAVKSVNSRISIQMDLLAGNIGTLEGVDPYAAATRVNDLLTQIETAYALTARIQKLSLLDFL